MMFMSKLDNAAQMRFLAQLRDNGRRLHEAEDLGTLIEIRDWLSEVIEQEKPSSPEPHYNRKVLVDVLVHHWPNPDASCLCGWAELGRSFPEHVANVYEQAVS